MDRVLVVLPSYNEKENIVALAEAILKNGSEMSVCVVDDSSPDKTYEIVAQAIKDRNWQDRVHLIVRGKKDGRGGAVRTGFDWGFSGEGAKYGPFATFVEMDCDFSHLPEAIPTGMALLAQGADVVLGCRYPNGTIVGWPLSRRIFSLFANLLARFLISWQVPDYTNGFRFYNRRAVAELVRHTQKHRGYIYLSESLSQLLRAGMKIATFPIYFKNRERGVSNTSLKEIRSAFIGIFGIAWNHRLNK